MRITILLLALVGFSDFVDAYIYDIKVLRKWDEQERRYHYFIGCSDFHDRSHVSNGPQRAEILRKLAGIDKKQTHLLIEDLSSANHHGTFGCDSYYLACKQGILAGLAQECLRLGISTENLEYRYCRVISLGGLVAHINQNSFSLPPLCNLSVGLLLQEINQTLAEIYRYNDQSSLNIWYRSCCAAVRAALKGYKFEQVCNSKLAHYFETNAPAQGRMTFLKRLLTFDSSLLDCKIVHAVVSHRQAHKIVALAGGTHIQQVVQQLEKIGYQTVYSVPVSYQSGPDLNRCVNSPAMPAMTAKPKPINLDILDKYLF